MPAARPVRSAAPPAAPPAASPPTLPPRRALAAAIGVLLAFTATLALPRVATSPPVFGSVAAAALLCAGWLAAVARRAHVAGRPLEAIVVIRRPHWVQLCMHTTLYVWWGLHVALVGEQAWLILLQLPLAYLLDLLLAWSRRRPWIIGFGPIPIIGSINLFLWFVDDWYALQLVMVALAFGGREFIKWRWLGRERHIFNPSGFALALASLGVIAAGASHITWGDAIATTLEVAPYMYTVMFAVGCVVMLLFRVTGVTVAAALTLWALGGLWHASTGEWFFTDTAIPIAVFLGMNLLITDPATSPENTTGRLLFGALYGAAVMPLYVGLQAIDTPSFYDKLLQVPLLNLLAPALHRAGAWIEARLPPLPGTAGQRNLALVALWAAAFFAIRPALVAHPGSEPATWRETCQRGDAIACQNLRHTLEKGCGLNRAAICHQLAEELADPTQLGHDRERARATFAKACRLGHAPSCAPPTAAPPPAIPTGDLERGCASGDGAACMALAGRHLAAEPRDAIAAAALLDRACAGGHALACVNLGLMLLRGDGLPRDPTRGAALHQRACDLGLAVACGRLGVLYRNGTGVPRDEARARAAFQKACDGGDRGACLTVER